MVALPGMFREWMECEKFYSASCVMLQSSARISGSAQGIRAALGAVRGVTSS